MLLIKSLNLRRPLILTCALPTSSQKGIPAITIILASTADCRHPPPPKLAIPFRHRSLFCSISKYCVDHQSNSLLYSDTFVYLQSRPWKFFFYSFYQLLQCTLVVVGVKSPPFLWILVSPNKNNFTGLAGSHFPKKLIGWKRRKFF